MIRELKEKDAFFMLEWMHSPEVTYYLSQDFAAKSLADCLNFIEKANRHEEGSCHYAIVNDKDEYLGTISLKNIDYKNCNAEYAIAIRQSAKGTGAAQKATQELLKIAFVEMRLEHIYLCVLSQNKRAINFYNKCGFILEGTFRNHHRDHDGKFCDLLWFGKIQEEYR